jgi:succinyl-CoA synthetase beta subunit
MAALLESDAKAVLAAHGISVPKGRVCRAETVVRDATLAAGGRVVVKAHVPAKGKGVAGGVQFADDPDEAVSMAKRLLGSTIAGFNVREVLVERREQLAAELYAAVALDGPAKAYRLTVAAAGGDGVEERLGRGAARSLTFRPGQPPRGWQIRDLLAACGVEGAALRHAPDAIERLARASLACDATLFEVNPLGIGNDDAPRAIGVLAAIDESALSRQPALAARAIPHVEQLLRPRTPWERAIDELDESLPDGGDIRFGEFPEGDIGMMVLGGGAGLVALDAVARLGGRPANFLDMTSASSPQAEEKVYRLTRAFLDVKRLRGLLIGSNIGAFLPVPVRMRGIVRAVRESARPGPGFPVVARLAGIADDEAATLVADTPIRYFRDECTLEDAVAHFMRRLAECP